MAGKNNALNDDALSSASGGMKAVVYDKKDPKYFDLMNDAGTEFFGRYDIKDLDNVEIMAEQRFGQKGGLGVELGGPKTANKGAAASRLDKLKKS